MEPMAGNAPASPHYECGILLLNHIGMKFLEGAAGAAPAYSSFAGYPLC